MSKKCIKPLKNLRCNSGLWRFFQCPPADLNNQDRSQTRDFLSTSWLRQVFLVVSYFLLNSPHISRYQVSLTTRHSQLLHHAAYIINGIKGIALYAKCHYAHCLWHLNTFSKRDYFVCPSIILCIFTLFLLANFIWAYKTILVLSKPN